MGIESGGNLGFGFRPIRQCGPELGTASLADAKVCRAGNNDAEFSLRHEPSLPP